MQKIMDQNFEIRILRLLRIFLKFSKRLRVVPLRSIWTIMVAAKLDQSRVLVTKFHQNRSTLKDRSASQRHTHRQTDSQTKNLAENNGPSGLQSGQQTDRHTTVLGQEQQATSTPWVKKGCHPKTNHGYNFVNSWSICKIFSLLQRGLNFQQNPYMHHTLSMLLHYLGKLKNQKFALCVHVNMFQMWLLITYPTDIC